jgi:hypothetical protein
MNSFPLEIDIKNKKIDYENYDLNFGEINYNLIINRFRRDIHELLVSRRDENEYFALDDFATRNSSSKYLADMTLTIVKELEEFGWKTKLSFGNTGLFIYSTENPPSSCW